MKNYFLSRSPRVPVRVYRGVRVNLMEIYMSIFKLKKLVFTLLLISGSKAVFSEANTRTMQIADTLFTRGSLSEKHQKMFHETALKMRLGHRSLEPKNVGILPRLLLGYHNAMSLGSIKRVYFNQDVLNELSDEQAQFLMAHELAHCRHNLPHAKNAISRYVPLMMNPPVARIYESDADSQHFNVGKMDPEWGIKLMKYLENPDDSKWPVYAKAQLKLVKVIENITSIPCLQFVRTHPTFEQRIKNLESLKPEWQKTQEKS